MWPFWGRTLLEGWGSGVPSSGAPSAGGASWALCQSGNQVSSQTLSTVWACQEGGVRNLSAWLMEGGRWYHGSIWQPLCTLSLKKVRGRPWHLHWNAFSLQPCQTFYQICHETVGRFIQYGILTVAEVRRRAWLCLPLVSCPSLSFLPPALPMIPFVVCMCVYIYIYIYIYIERERERVMSKMRWEK